MIASVLVGCSSKPAPPGLERFPVAPRVDCEEVTIEGDVTRSSRSEERCRVEGTRVRCTSKTFEEGAPVFEGWGEERFDAAGYWTLGNDGYTIEPPTLSFPADIAPGRTWTVEADMVMRQGGERYPFIKTFAVEASSECDDGLLVKSVRQVQRPGVARVENELVICPGSSSPRRYISRTSSGDELIRTTTGTCVMRDDP